MPPQRAAHKRGLANLVSPLLVRHTTTLPPAPTGRRHPAPTTRALPARTGQAADAAPAKSAAIIISHNDDDAATTTTTTTLLVDGLPFTTPTDPLEAFHATRSQTIASFRGISAGAPGARDMGFIFGPALAPTAAQSTVAGGLSISQQPPGAAASRRTGDTRDFCIDKHIFTVPAEPVPAFLATRDMTMAAFRRVMEGAAGVRDMALVSGTATISASGEEAVLVDKHVDRGGGKTPARPRGRKGDMPPPRVHKPLHISHDDDDNDADAESHDGAHSPSAPPAHAAATIRVRPKKTLQPPAAGAAAPTPAAAAPGGSLYRPKGFYANDLPLGDFTDIAHAKRVLGRSDAWCKGKYIDGMLTLGGERARSRLVTAGGGCTHCAVLLDREGVAAVCRVLVGDEDRWVRMRKRKCGRCVQMSQSCHMRGGGGGGARKGAAGAGGGKGGGKVGAGAGRGGG